MCLYKENLFLYIKNIANNKLINEQIQTNTKHVTIFKTLNKGNILSRQPKYSNIRIKQKMVYLYITKM